MAVSVACAHAPAQRDRPQTEDFIARSIWYATTVPEPAATYEVEVPPSVSAKRVLKLTASFPGLVVAGPRTLQRPDFKPQESSKVRIKILSVDWTTPQQALIRLTLEARATYSCSVGLRHAALDHSWSFEPMGEEYCWPRPSKLPSS